jgi:DUF1009 family protein
MDNRRLDNAFAVALISGLGSFPEKVKSSTKRVASTFIFVATKDTGLSTTSVSSKFAMALLLGAP